MAITACEAFGTLKPPVRIIATDVDTQVLATAGRGVYNIDRVTNSTRTCAGATSSAAAAQRGQCRVLPALRADRVPPLNLLAPRYDVSALDALFCRNVMIYFDKPTQRAILPPAGTAPGR